MKRVKHILIGAFIMLSLFNNEALAQDARYTQTFYSNPLVLNPAIMGMNRDLKAIVNYRTQWATVGKGYTSAAFTGMYPLFMNDGKEKLDLGLNVRNNTEGAFTAMNASLSVGYNLKLSNSGYLSFALQGGFMQKSLNTSNLTFDDQYVLGSFSASNPTQQVINSKKINYADVGFGLMWYYNPEEDDAKLNAYVGVSGYHLNSPAETMINAGGQLPRRISTQAGVKLKGDGKIDFTPNVIANWQGGSQALAAGILMDYRVMDSGKMMLGIWYRSKDAYPIMIGFQHDYFIINYSYDVTSSVLGRAINGMSTHEITLGFRMNMADKKGSKMAPSIY